MTRPRETMGLGQHQACFLRFALKITAFGITALAMVLLAATGHADEPNPDTQPAPAPQLTRLPELVEFVQAEYPVVAKEKGIEGVVVLLITVDDTGAVAEVQIKTPAGHGFDEAALAAARRFHFKPALLGDKPVAVAITYTYRFSLSPPASSSQPASAPSGQPVNRRPTSAGPTSRPAEVAAPLSGPVNLIGRVRERGTRTPLSLVEVSLPKLAGQSQFTDEDGRFAFRGIPSGKHTIHFAKSGYRIAQVEALVTAGEKTEVQLFLEKLAYNTYQLTVRGKRPKQVVTRHVLKREELQRIPGTHGDTIKVVEVLPGVARTPMGLGGLIILRGADHQSSRVYLDAVSLPYLFHFGGLRSVINSDLIQSLDLYPGNVGAFYSDLIGGVIDVTTRRPKNDRLHAQLDLNIYEGGLLVEGPLGDKVSFFAAIHRNWHDLILGAVMDDEHWKYTVAPRYYDYQAKLHWAINPAHSLEVFWLGTDDEMKVVVGKDEEVGFNFGQHDYFHQMNIKHRFRISPRLSNNLTSTLLFIGQQGDFGAENHVDLLGINGELRDDLTWQLSRRLQLGAGLFGGVSRFDLDFTAPHFNRDGESELSHRGTVEKRSSVDIFTVFYTGAYLELELRPWDWLRLIPGGRVDYRDYNGSFSAGGNLTARFRLREGTELKGAVGTYDRFPGGAEMAKDYGNPDLQNERSFQYSVGVEQKIYERIDADLTLFYNDMHDLVVTNPALNIDPDALPYINDGRGRSYGLELMIKHAPSKYFSGWLSYTLSRSERKFPGHGWDLFTFDQTHILNLVGMVQLPRNWSVGFRFNLVSGNPTDLYTERGGFNADSGSYIPVTGTMKNDRLPLIHALDLRVDKTFVFDRWLWTVYLDVKNVYDHRNVEFLNWNYDYTKYEHITGLPILPAIGSRIEF